jgi:hypothetical protein
MAAACVNPGGNQDPHILTLIVEVGLLFTLSNPSVTRGSVHHAITVQVCVEELRSG